jgi:S-formylglutathione hydrolase
MTGSQVTTEFHEVKSAIRGEEVPVSVLLPPGFDRNGPSLPLLIHLHGGGGDRTMLTEMAPLYGQMFDQGSLPPVVTVSFSSGPSSFYYGDWEKWVTDELPAWANQTFGSQLDPANTLMMGISMGGYGSLKIAFKNPKRFCAIAPMEPAIMPTLEWPEQHKRGSWWLPTFSAESVWGSPFDPAAFLADNPANIARDNAEEIRASGLEIYLECGDQDFINLHDGAEFLHRVLWDNDIRHEYHQVRWADHVGVSLERRIVEAHAFLAAALGGGLSEPIDLPLTAEEQAFADYTFGGGALRGDPAPTYRLDASGDRGPSVHAALWKPLRDLALNDPEMKRAYGRLPTTDGPKTR